MPSSFAVFKMSCSSLSSSGFGLRSSSLPQELRLAHLVARGAVAADAHAEDARAAALALRLQHRVENRLAAAVEVAIGLELLVRQRVLRADVFAAAALEHEPHAHFRRAMLMKMKRGRARPDVRAVILAGERIHGVLAQITLLRRQLHGFLRRFLKRDLVEADRAIHVEQNAAGVLADRLRLLFGQLRCSGR